MYKTDEKYGKVRMNSYLPSQRAVRYLNYFHTAGWHRCNDLYHQKYDEGIAGALIIFTVGGKGTLKLGDKMHMPTAGTVAIIPPNNPMEYFTCVGEDWEFYWINVYGTYAIKTLDYILEEHQSVFHVANMMDYLEKVKCLIFLNNENKLNFELEVSQRIAELMHELVNGIFFISNEKLQCDDLPMKIAVYIEQHYAESIHMDKLSESFYISQNQFIRIFQAEIGYTPYEYLKKHRLLKACELLQMTKYTVKEVGDLVGFKNCSNFIFQFKSQYKVTPITYRKLFSPVLNCAASGLRKSI